MSFIKLDRKLLDWEWKDKPEMVALWVEILLQANAFDNDWHGNTYESGSFPTSIGKLSKGSGLTERTVRTCLKRLKMTNEVTIEATKQGTKIIVNKWAQYQGLGDDTDIQSDKGIDNQVTNERQTSDNTIRKIERKERKNNNIVRFVKPTLEEVRAYCQERNNGINPQKFLDYYDANGWKVGRNPMKDWKASIRNWESNNKPKEEPKKWSETPW